MKEPLSLNILMKRLFGEIKRLYWMIRKLFRKRKILCFRKCDYCERWHLERNMVYFQRTYLGIFTEGHYCIRCFLALRFNALNWNDK